MVKIPKKPSTYNRFKDLKNKDFLIEQRIKNALKKWKKDWLSHRIDDMTNLPSEIDNS